MRSSIDKLLETLVIGLTGKTLDRQRELVRHSANHFSGTISKSGDNFGERLANESEDHMLKIVRRMDYSSIKTMLWKLRKLKHASQKHKTYYIKSWS